MAAAREEVWEVVWGAECSVRMVVSAEMQALFEGQGVSMYVWASWC